MRSRLVEASCAGWTGSLPRQMQLPEDEQAFLDEVLPRVDRTKVRLEEYDLESAP